MTKRLENLRAKLKEKELDAIWVATPENRRWVSGFTGSAGHIFVTQKEAVLATDFRYVEQAAQQSPAFRVHRQTSSASGPGWFVQVLNDLALGGKKVGFEAHTLTVAQFKSFTDALGQAPAEQRPHLTQTTGIIEELRVMKDAEELALLQKAIDQADKAMDLVAPKVRPGMKEREVAWEMEKAMREAGADALSFDIIVGAGPNGALPHHRADDTVIKSGDAVVIDMGAKCDGYCSDLTRTIAVGKPDDTFKKVYDIVLTAQLTAMSLVRPGMTGHDCDAIARKVIAEAGYGETFGHALGHGVGLAVHENPRVGANAKDVLELGMVFTIEPGIYVTGWGGVRIEDVVILEANGARSLSHARRLDTFTMGAHAR